MNHDGLHGRRGLRGSAPSRPLLLLWEEGTRRKITGNLQQQTAPTRGTGGSWGGELPLGAGAAGAELGLELELGGQEGESRGLCGAGTRFLLGSAKPLLQRYPQATPSCSFLKYLAISRTSKWRLPHQLRSREQPLKAVEMAPAAAPRASAAQTCHNFRRNGAKRGFSAWRDTMR